MDKKDLTIIKSKQRMLISRANNAIEFNKISKAQTAINDLKEFYNFIDTAYMYNLLNLTFVSETQQETTEAIKKLEDYIANSKL